jgi:archaellum biogenesis ATPase FlaH
MSLSFYQSSTIAKKEKDSRRSMRDGLLSFGVDYLDHAMEGILKNDLILIGAHSGGGKTQFCCNVAMHNAKQGKRVHYVALEAEQYEIERRILYQLFVKHYLADRDRNHIQLNFQKWMLGDFLEIGKKYEELATEEFQETYKTLFTFYKQGDFNVTKFIETVVLCSGETDLIIVDHVHYFDYDDENENRAVKEIAKTARSLSLEQGVPIILVSHIRKRDRNNNDLVPGQEEFHGSSDLFKIATKGITLAPGAWKQGRLETFFRIVKNRFEGSVTRFVACIDYINSRGNYEKEYEVGDSNQKRTDGFRGLDKASIPDWARGHRPRQVSDHDLLAQNPTSPFGSAKGSRVSQTFKKSYQGHDT